MSHTPIAVLTGNHRPDRPRSSLVRFSSPASLVVRATALLILLLSSLGAEEIGDSLTEDTRPVLVIPISGNVDPGMAAFLGRAVRESMNYPNPLIILDMDTFGGRVDAALDIVDTMLSLPADVTVAFVRKRAISAGALIALSCGKLVMKPNTTIGDCAPIAYSNEGPEILGEKFQSPLRAKFRALAKRNGYPSALAEAMVTAEMTVFQVVLPDTTLYLDSLGLAELNPTARAAIRTSTTVVPSGELLTMDDQEARELGFSSMTVGSIEAMLQEMEIDKYDIVRFEETWSETLVKAITAIAPILLMIGFAALYVELKSPGFGVPGIVGILCLALVFGSQYMVGLADYTELLLIIIGVLLLAVELLVLPGFGMVGIAGIGFVAAGMVLSMQGFVVPEPSLPWQAEPLRRNILMVLLSLSGSVVLLLLFFRFAFPRLGRIVSGPYLGETLATSRVDSDMVPSVVVGQEGVVVNPLRPSGKVQFGDDVLDVTTEGGFCDRGTPVVVAKIEGMRVVVEKVERDAH